MHTKFYWARFVLGVAEAGFFPGVIVYLTHWYRAADRARAVAKFMSAIPLSQVVGAPISAALLKAHWYGWSGWRWLLILEGAPAILLGIVTLFYLTDRPEHAKWLPPDERDWIARELQAERATHVHAGWLDTLRSLSDRNVLLLTLTYFCGATLQYGFGLWLPKIIEKLSGFTPFAVTLVSAIPYVVAWPAMLFVGWSSDRMRERRIHTAACLTIAGLALLASQYTGNNVALGIAIFSIASMGINGRLPGFWALPSMFLGGTSAAAAIGAINCIGNLGGFFGPDIVGILSKKYSQYHAGVAFLIGSAFVGAIAVMLVERTDRTRFAVK